MILTRTVFVLGAGASEPYGFPTGSGLLNSVVNKLSGTDGISDLKEGCGFSEAQIEEFRIALCHSGHTSVDAFLEHRTDLVEIGKAAMALVLIRCENGTGTLFEETTKTWLRYLYGRMNCKFDDFFLNHVSFITFNYDRVLEHFLHTSLLNSHNKSAEECGTEIEKIPIVHLHGNLGDLPWQARRTSNGNFRAFEPTINQSTLNIARKNIKIIHDATAGGDEDFLLAKQLLKEAEQVIFLGFGYNGTNMDRLDLKSIMVRTIGTGYGMTAQEISDGERRSKSRLEITGHDCINLLRSRDW